MSYSKIMTFDYPKDPAKNLAWRHKLLRRAREDIEFRLKLRKLFFEDPLFAFNGFFYTLDVRKRPFHHLPFCTYPYQDEAILSLVESINLGRDEVWEKSRDMGASWMILLVFLWFWLNPEGGSDFLMGSRVEDYVDRKGDMRTLFEKLRYALYRLPKWLRPRGFAPRKHDTYMRLLNPETGASIIGESNNANFSTGGRFLAVLFDEFAKWESTDVASWTAAGDASPCRVANSTPFGAGGQYYQLVLDGRTKKTRLHWSLHPEKALGLSCVWPPPNEDAREQLGEHWRPEERLTSPWYEEECKRRSPVEVAQELDIDYLGAGNPVFDGKAWAALQAQRRLPEKVLSWWKPDLKEMRLEETKEAPLDPEGYFVLYEERDFSQGYTIGVDVVEGVEGGDYAVVCVVNTETLNVAGRYFSRLDEVLLARVVKAISEFFSPEEDSPDAPWVGVETTGPGLATFDFCQEYGVNNLFLMPSYDTVRGGVSFKKGWRTTTSSRNELVAGIREYLLHNLGELRSQRLIGELMTFVRSRTGKPQAKEGCHDDEVMAFGIALQVHYIVGADLEEPTKPRNEYDPHEFRKNNLESYKLEEEDPLSSYEEACLATIARKRNLIENEDVFLEAF